MLFHKFHPTHSVVKQKAGTVNILKFRTLENNYFPAVSNFRNYISEKVLVFVILECGLYHEQKWYIFM